MSAQRKNKYIPKAPATEVESTGIESTEVNAETEATEDNTEIQATDDESVEVTVAAEIEVNDQDQPEDPEVVSDSGAQVEEPVSESTDQAAEVNDADVTDPEPESAHNEPDNGPLVAEAAPMEPAPVSQGTDASVPATSGRDPRLPAVGSVITRRYKDRDLNVTVVESGFLYEGQHYKSLSKLAGIISGQVCNGFAFFRLTGPTGTASAKTPKATRQASKSSGDKLADKIAKIDGLILKLRAALDEGAAALAEAQVKRAEMAPQAGALEGSR
jgi:hypothetical protein